ncbi:uncharacterized protein [Gossypium hirsutum]|uniref:Uncharacterized protein n=1 Tax=Gossypium hirsutum TaxID=3635 RepID=A0A1U8KNQ5_GOSHI|nr:uncharacterized protein LOC107919083 [Gossypium hirsutum]
MADALATLAFMIKSNKKEDVRPIQMSISEVPDHFCNIEEEEKDDHPWYQDILRYVRNREYLEQAIENEKRTLRRLACEYVLDGDILYKRRKDQVILRCVDSVEARQILEEVHEEIKLDKAEWIQSRYDQLNLIEEKRLRAIHHG